MTVKTLKLAAPDQSGFSLWELLAALAVVSLLIAVLIPNLSSTVDFGSRQKTESRLAVLKDALTDAYRNNAMAIDDRSGSKVTFESGGTLKTALSRAPAQRSTYQSGFDELAEYSGSSGITMASDGFNTPWQVYVSKRLSKQWQGYKVYYHVIAIVSNQGGDVHNGKLVLNSGTSFNKSTGQLTLGDNDVGIVVSGFPIQVDMYRKTLDRMHKIAGVFQKYFETNYKSNPQRDASIFYFSKACPSAGNANRFANVALKNSCGHTFKYPAGNSSSGFSSSGSCTDSQIISANNNGHVKAFGLHENQLKTAWGYPLGYGVGPGSHCKSHNVYSRNPAATNADYKRPPYTALIEAWGPGGVSMVVVATGAY